MILSVLLKLGRSSQDDHDKKAEDKLEDDNDAAEEEERELLKHFMAMRVSTSGRWADIRDDSVTNEHADAMERPVTLGLAEVPVTVGVSPCASTE